MAPGSQLSLQQRMHNSKLRNACKESPIPGFEPKSPFEPKTANLNLKSIGGSQVDKASNPFYPQSGRDYAPDEEPIPMTLCIAAECWHNNAPAIVLCCDTRAERGAGYQELVGSEDVWKIRHMGTASALLSGSETKADELLTLCDQPIKEFTATTKEIDSESDSDIVVTRLLSELRAAAGTKKRELIDHYLKMSIGMGYQDFVDKHKDKFSESHSRDIWNEIRLINLEVDIIICAFDAVNEAIIVRLDRYGQTHWESNYSAIGAGADIALAFLCQHEWDETMPLMHCLYYAYEAKIAAHANRHVGQDTAFEILMNEGTRFDISDLGFAKLKNTHLKKHGGKTHRFERLRFSPTYLDASE